MLRMRAFPKGWRSSPIGKTLNPSQSKMTLANWAFDSWRLKIAASCSTREGRKGRERGSAGSVDRR